MWPHRGLDGQPWGGGAGGGRVGLECLQGSVNICCLKPQTWDQCQSLQPGEEAEEGAQEGGREAAGEQR